MTLFEWLEGTSVAYWVGGSLWGYPFLLSLHIVGLSIIVGVTAMLDLRLLGSFKGLRIDSFLDAMKFAWAGLAINATSGVLLFTSQASFFVTSTPFLSKISLIAAGVILSVIIQRKLRAVRDSGDASIVDGAACKLLAASSLAAWIGAIVTGRLIAYL